MKKSGQVLVRVLPLLQFIVVLLTLTGLSAGTLLSCKERSADSLSLGEGSDAPVPTTTAGGDVCAKACSDLDPNENWAVCYSCRCKEAMGGWLPTAEQLRCDKGNEIVVFKGEKTASGLKLEKITTEEKTCFNPPRLPDARKYGGGCYPGSRLGQLQKGDVYFKWICRREKFHANFADADLNYEDTGIVGFNAATGATCFWDDSDDVINNKTNPEIDLTDGNKEKTRKFLDKYYRQEGDSCVGCHDNDPFMYSPYLASTKWTSNDDTYNGKYHRIVAATDATAAKKKLDTKALDAGDCSSCHRIGQGGTCRLFAADSMGKAEIDSLQDFMKSGRPEDFGKTEKDGSSFTWPVWMPPPRSSFPKNHEAWMARYGSAMKKIETCCKNPDAAECTWDDISAD